MAFDTYRSAEVKGAQMSLKEALLIALRAVRAHWLRSMLTMLGLIIGVSAVMLLSACGQGVRNSVDARIETVPGAPAAQSLTEEDAGALLAARNESTGTTVPIAIDQSFHSNTLAGGRVPLIVAIISTTCRVSRTS